MKSLGGGGFSRKTGASDSSFRGLGFGFLKWLLLEKMEGFPFEVARSLRGDTGRGTGIGEQVGGLVGIKEYICI